MEFSLPALSSEYVARYAVNKMFKRKTIIIPGVKMGTVCAMAKITPRKMVLKILYNSQKRKKIL